MYHIFQIDSWCFRRRQFSRVQLVTDNGWSESSDCYKWATKLGQ